MTDQEKPTERDALLILLQEEPKVAVTARTDPSAVVLVVNYRSGGLTIPLGVAAAREVADKLITYADKLDRIERSN